MVANAFNTFVDIQQLLRVAFGGQGPLQAKIIVSTEISLQRLETFLPLAIGFGVSFLYCLLIEAAGHLIVVGFGLSGRKAKKFVEPWTEMVYFSVQIFLSYRLFAGSLWFWPSGWVYSLEDGLRGDIAGNVDGLPPYQCAREVRAYYVCEFGYYASQLLRMFFKKRRKDFWAMAFHHIVTSTLIMLSYSLWHLRIGVVVMMLHNLFDPFLNIAKCVHYVFKGPLHIMADIFFAAGAIVFLVSRLIMYPYLIYCAVAYASPAKPHPNQLTQNLLKLFLCCLFPIHVYWFYLIIKVAKKAVTEGVQDVRSSSSEDEDEKTTCASSKKSS